MNIYLMGYMGSGKSVIGKELAIVLGYCFIDFDTHIEQLEGLSIGRIFDTKGEIYFRKKETLYLEELTTSNRDNTIIALGGGTPCYGANLKLILDSGASSTYLHTSVQELTQRLWKERSQRPLISSQKSKENLEEFIRKHLFERGFYYNQANRVLKTDGKTIPEIVQEIVAPLF